MRPLLLGATLLVAVVVAPPPNRGAQQPPPPDQVHPSAQVHEGGETTQVPQRPLYEFTYSKYLEEVVKILETDPIFNDKLRQMSEDDIKAGKIADHVDELPDPIVQRLHTLKMAELERLRELIAKQVEADKGAHNIKLPEHIDLENWEKFNKEDLRKLIKTTVADMEEIDRQRKSEFKEYEMKKKAEEDHKFAEMPPEERERAKHEAEEQKKRHEEHEKLKHPGSRDQLEEVWEESDQMPKDNFDPKTFFNLHDLNGDGFWNNEELEALFRIELDKMYNETNPDDDPREKVEEMYRMREHVVNQMDKNGDRLISQEEFLADSEAQTQNKDPGWEDIGQQLDQNQIYTDEELRKFEEEYAKQMGWGDNAYQPVDAPPGAHDQQQQQQQHGQPQPIQPEQVNRGGVPDPSHHQQPPVQPQPVVAQPPAPPVQHQQQQQQQQQQAQQQQQQQQAQQQQQHQAPQQVQPHVPIHDIPKDPAYGI